MSKIHAAGYRPTSTAKGTHLFEKKKKIEARLNCLKTTLRNHITEKARKRNFQKTDTVAFKSQFPVTGAAQTSSQDASRATPVNYHLPERAALVRLTCTPANGLTEQGKFTRQIRVIEARAALCHRQESRRRQPQYHIKHEEPDASTEDSTEERKDRFPLICKPTECIFCLGNESKPIQKRLYEYVSPLELCPAKQFPMQDSDQVRFLGTLPFPPQRNQDPQEFNRTDRKGTQSLYKCIKSWPAYWTDKSGARDLNLLVRWAKTEF